MSNPINYDPNTPLITESFDEWQENFIQNFMQLANAFAVDHVALDAVSENGNHTNVHLVEQENPQQTGISEISAYVKQVPGQTDQLFMRLPGNGTEFQYSNYQIYTVDNLNFFTFIPGGLIVYFGIFNYAVAPGQGSKKQLRFNPPIVKNIIAVNFTSLLPVVGAGVFYSELTKDKDTNIIPGIVINAVNNQYYMVIANVV